MVSLEDEEAERTEEYKMQHIQITNPTMDCWSKTTLLAVGAVLLLDPMMPNIPGLQPLSRMKKSYVKNFIKWGLLTTIFEFGPT